MQQMGKTFPLGAQFTCFKNTY